MTTETIDMTPTWEETARMLVVLLRDGDIDGKKYAESEIVRMGQIIDQMKAQQAT